MTTFILHGGKTSIQNSQNDKFFEQFTKLVDKEEVTILLCYFSREKNQWASLITRDTDYIKRNTTKKVNIWVAQNPKDLFEKLEKADVLYVAGGEAEFIEPLYKNLTDLKTKLNNKVYVGSSMGAFMACEQYVLSLDSQASKAIHQGLGLLPLQILCHFDKENNKEMKLELLTKNSPKPVLVLNEFEFVVLYR